MRAEPARAVEAMMRILAITLLVLSLSAAAAAQTADDIPVSRLSQPPKIDGILDDEAWKIAPLTMTADQWVSYQPVRGDKMPENFRTDVRIELLAG